MKNSLILILITFALLAVTTSALNSPVKKKSLLFRNWGKNAFTDAFRTKNATITFTTERVYRALGFQPSNTTEILSSLSYNCDGLESIFSRLAYYERSDSLLYFCQLNRSLLVLDSTSYKVQRSISLSYNFPYLQNVRLYPENDSLVILLINNGYNQFHTFNNTIFLRLNLTTEQITQNFTLDRGFGSNEAVVSYAGNGTNSYILTNSYDWSPERKNFTVYAFNTSGNNYNATGLYTETFYFVGEVGLNDIYTQLFVAGDLVMTNNNNSILLFNRKGDLISRVYNLNFYTTFWFGEIRYPAFFEGRNKTFYYESNGVITQFTVKGSLVNSKVLVNGSQLQVARGNSQQADQVFFLQEQATSDDSYWYVLDLDTSKIISQFPRVYDDIFTTDISYGILHNKTVSVFSWATEAFLGKLTIEQSGGSNDQFYYYDSENSFFYYLRYPISPAQCVLVQFDIKTGVYRNISSFNSSNICLGRITQVNSTSLDFVIEDNKGGYFINSALYGQLNFSYTFQILKQGFASVNFNTNLTVDLIHYSLPTLSWNHSLYTFNNNSRLFTFQNASKVFGLDATLYVFRYSGGQKIFATSESYFYPIDLNSNTADRNYVSFKNPIFTQLFGNNGGEGFIITDKQRSSELPYYYIPETNELKFLPTNTFLALDAIATGRCKYSQTNGMPNHETVIDIYDFCANSESEKVSFIRHFLRRYSQ